MFKAEYPNKEYYINTFKYLADNAKDEFGISSPTSNTIETGYIKLETKIYG